MKSHSRKTIGNALDRNNAKKIKKWKAFKKSGGGGGPQPSGFDPSHQGSPDPPQLTVLAIYNVNENLIMYLRL